MWLIVLQLVLKVRELTCLPSKWGPLFTCPKWVAGRKNFSHYVLLGHLNFCLLLLASVPPAPSLCVSPQCMAGFTFACSIHTLDYHHSAAACGEALNLSLILNQSLSLFLMISLWRFTAALCCPLPSEHQFSKKPGSGRVQIEPYKTTLLILTHPHGVLFFLSVIGFCHAIQTNHSLSAHV